MAEMMKGFQRIMASKVKEIKGRGGKTAKGKRVRNPKAYVAAGLRKTGIRKYGKAGFKARQRRGRRKARR